MLSSVWGTLCKWYSGKKNANGSFVYAIKAGQFFQNLILKKEVSLYTRIFLLLFAYNFGFLLSESTNASPVKIPSGFNCPLESQAQSFVVILSATSVTCTGMSNGSITSTVTGNSGGPVNFTLTPGPVSNKNGLFTNLSAGTYMVSADDGGLVSTASIVVTEPAVALSSSIVSQTNVDCKGSINGSVTIKGNNGTPGYTYSSDGGATFQANGTFGPLNAGTYTLLVKDAGGCMVNQTVVIHEPVNALTSAILSQSNILCKGGSSGSLTVAGNGGTAGYSYSKNGGATYQGSGSFGSLPAGSYSIRIKDANGCLTDQTVLLTEPLLPLTVLVTSNSPVCNNSVLTLTANGSGGTSPFTYSWTGPGSFSSTLPSPAIVNPTLAAAGNYTVTVKDANNCTATNSVSVSIIAAPIVTVNASIGTICQGGAVTLTSSSNIPPPPTLPLPVLTATNNSTGGITANAAWTLQNDGYTTNGLTFHSNDSSPFYLSDSHSQNGIKTETSLKSQAYSTVGYSSFALNFWHYFRFNGAPNESASVQVSTDGTTWTTVASYTNTVGSCNGFVNENINLNGYINKPVLYFRFYYYADARARYWAIDNITVSGTSAIVLPVISWSSVPAGFTSTVANPPAVNPAVTTVYSVTYTDPATGCSQSASTTVTVNPKPNVTIQPNYCAVPGHVRLTAGGGTTYTWSTGETTNPILVDLADTYGVTSTNAFGCTGSAFLPVSTELVANGDFSAGNIGFTNAYGYTTAANGLFPEGLYAVGADPTFFHSNFWGRDHTSNSGNFLIVNGIGSPGVVVWQETVSTLPNTDYYFSAWAISLNSVPPYANLQFDVNGILVGTTAPLAARPANNNPPYNWQRFYGNWNSGPATTAVIQIVDLQTALGGNDFGLDDVSFGTLAPIPFTIAPSVNPSAVLCSGKTMYLKSNITGGRAPVTYSWTGPNGFVSSQKDPVIPNVTVAYSGLYTLSVVDGYGCNPVIATTNATILPSPNPVISSISGSGNVCPAALEKYWTTPQGNVTNNWSVTGGSIIGSSVKDTVNIQWTLSGSGQITLKSVNTVNLCDSTITKTVLIQDLIPPVITCPPLLNLSGCDETALTVNPYAASGTIITLSQLTLAGGSASDNCALASISYKDVKSGTNPMVINRTYTAADNAGNKSSCLQIINISDLDPPVLAVPASFGFCVENLISASIVSSLLKINPAPDYFLLKKGNPALDLNPAGFSDNCTPSNQLILHWRIDFSPLTPFPSISGTGQPSTFSTDITFPGDGSTFLDLNHTITYWVVDLSGNESVHKTVQIAIHPRPVVSYRCPPAFKEIIASNKETPSHATYKYQKDP